MQSRRRPAVVMNVAIGQAVRMTGPESRVPARSVYELRVIHPATGELHRQQLKNTIADFVFSALELGGQKTANVFVKVTLDIVDRRTHETVLTMEHDADNAKAMVELISADLDRLDAPSFAREWGIMSDS